MPIVPLIGHTELRARLAEAVKRNTLPASLLLTGPRGVGKQRLALWLGQFLLCENASHAPCGKCQGCHFAVELTHPDLHWYFPRPRGPVRRRDAGSVFRFTASASRARSSVWPMSGTMGISG